MKNLEIGIEQAMFESKKDDWNIKILATTFFPSHFWSPEHVLPKMPRAALSYSASTSKHRLPVYHTFTSALAGHCQALAQTPSTGLQQPSFNHCCI